MSNKTTEMIKTILWIAVFFIWVFSRILKKFLQKKGDSGQNRYEMLKGNFSGFFKEVSEKMELAGQKTESVRKPLTSIVQPKYELPPPIPGNKTGTVTASVTETRVSESPFGLNLSPKGLRHAVILSEILGPPIALRNEDEVRNEK